MTTTACGGIVASSKQGLVERMITLSLLIRRMLEDV